MSVKKPGRLHLISLFLTELARMEDNTVTLVARWSVCAGGLALVYMGKAQSTPVVIMCTVILGINFARMYQVYVRMKSNDVFKDLNES